MGDNYQKVFRGRDSLKKIPQMAEKLGITRPMVIGSEKLVQGLLKKAPFLLQAPVFTGYHANPDLRDAEPAAELFQKQGCDGLVSIGGGSAMDTAKAVKALLNAEKTEDVAANRFPEKMRIPHLAIPGTAGSGAEATQTAVVYQDGKKLSLNHPALRPDGVILDASLLDTLPDYHRKSCALDALCQGIESYWSTASTEDSRVHAYLAILGVLDNLKAYLAGDAHAAEEMMDASYQSGKAIQLTRTTAAHAMSYQLTKTMGLAHGHACMLTLPVLWEHMETREEGKEKLRDLSEKMRLGDLRMGPRLLRGILFDLDMQIPSMPEESILDMLADTVNTERLANHPVPMSRSEVREVYRQAFLPLCEAEKQACLDLWNYYGA